MTNRLPTITCDAERDPKYKGFRVTCTMSNDDVRGRYIEALTPEQAIINYARTLALDDYAAKIRQ